MKVRIRFGRVAGAAVLLTAAAMALLPAGRGARAAYLLHPAGPARVLFLQAPGEQQGSGGTIVCSSRVPWPTPVMPCDGTPCFTECARWSGICAACYGGVSRSTGEARLRTDVFLWHGLTDGGALTAEIVGERDDGLCGTGPLDRVVLLAEDAG